MSEHPNPVVDLMKQHGIYGLCESDGCLCAGFEVHHISVDVHCRKSNGGLAAPYREGPYFSGTVVRVHSRSLGIGAAELEPVAREAARQLWPQVDWVPLVVRFCSWEDDNKCRCVYCHKEREPAAYLCAECLVKEDACGDRVADRFRFPTIELEPLPPPPAEGQV